MKYRFFLLALALGLSGCSDSDPVRLTGGTMGTSWSISIPNAGGIDLDSLHLEVMQKLSEVNASMSTWDAESEISQFNQMSAGCMSISPAFGEVVDTALELSAITDGAYDVSLGPLIDLWGFGAGDAVEAPGAEQIQTVLELTGYQHIELDDLRLCKDSSDIEINLSSIAKGYGVDVIATLLRGEGIENFLVEIGGELLAWGDKNGETWMVGVENPANLVEQSAMLALPLVNQAVATSGDYRNFFVLDGRRYSHIIDARTGRPLENQLASVTVIADSVMLADGWATALMAVGAERAIEIADEQGLALLLILRDGDAFQTRANALWVSLFGELG